MKDWWIKKKGKTRKSKKRDDQYTLADFIFDVLLWIPELVFLPFRILFWLVRGLSRSILDFLN